jgi:hypothetical protein
MMSLEDCLARYLHVKAQRHDLIAQASHEVLFYMVSIPSIV